MTLIITESEHLDDAPRDTVTLLFTDLEGSTQLLEALGEDYPRIIARSRQLLQEATARYGGVGIDFQGDASFAVFRTASDGVLAAVDMQRAFHGEAWPLKASVRVRIGLHTGQPRIVDGSYFGLDVHRGARIAGAGSGGQVVLSASTRAQLKDDDIPRGVVIRDLGAHRLKDIRYPEILFDLSIPGLPDTFASLGPADTRPNNLPMSPTTFVGREQQLQELRELLLRPSTRLLTLTGPGGTGKTRLALEAASSVLGSFSHGVFLVQLALVPDPNLLAWTIVQALGVPEFATKTPLETLKHYLTDRQILLVLDNFEQIVEAGTVVLELLAHCPKMKVLVTSREALNVRVEREYAVPPLELPHEGARRDVQSLATIESVRLLIDRVGTYDPQLTLTAKNADAICSICARLDGLPLALELAASQLKLYTPQALLEDLRNSLEVLSGGPRDLAHHQRTLNDTIAWSYQLLNDHQQLLFRRLSVFRGGSTIDSAVAIGSDGQPRAEVVRTLLSLVNKSLLTHASVEGEPRVGMLETIHEFGRRRLAETAEHRDVHERHAQHYLAFAERMAPGLMGRDQRRFVTAVLGEQDNLRAALAWAIQQGDASMTSRLLGALLWTWIPRGKFTEGRTWVGTALDRFAPLGPCREVALIVEAAGWLQVLGGDYPAALPLFERSYQIFHALPDVKDQVRSKITLGVTCLVLDDPRGAELSDQAVALCRLIDDKHVTALALLSAGVKHQLSGDPAQASVFYDESLRAFFASDNVFWPGQLLQNLAHLRLQDGDWREAAVLASQALQIGREYNYPMIRNLSLAVMGAVAVAKGTSPQAAQFFGAVDASLTDLGVTFEPPEHAAMLMNIDATRSVLSAEAYAAAFEEGRHWGEGDITVAVLSLRDEPVSLKQSALETHIS